MILSSCFSSDGRVLDGRDRDLYNNVGYLPDRVPDQVINKKTSRRQVYTPAPKRRRAPYQSDYYPPSSRLYTNPYSLNPPLNRPYYDSDQYYTPPYSIDQTRGVKPTNYNYKYNNPRRSRKAL